MRTIETALLRIELEDEGPPGASPVLLLHGWPDAARGWRPIAESLQSLGWRTLVPSLRGFGGTRFRDPKTPRDGRGIALATDAIDLLGALNIERLAIVGHDWGARVAYTLGALAPERVAAIVALGLPYSPRGRFAIPPFPQARAFWYQWLMCFDAGARAVAADPIAFARIQWDTWSPPGWYDEGEFQATARSFTNPDWVAITLSAYRSRFLKRVPIDPRYDSAARQLEGVEQIAIPTLQIAGDDDRCDEPSSWADQDQYFTGGFEQISLPGVGHFSHREAPETVTQAIHRYLHERSGGRPVARWTATDESGASRAFNP